MTERVQLDVLIVEDNPGDVRLIEEMLRDAESLLQRIDAGDVAADAARVHHEPTLEAGLEALSNDAFDVVLLDLGLPKSRGLDTLTAVIDATEFVPVVVLTGLDNESVGIKAIQHGAQDYLVKDEVTSELLVRSIHYAIERNRQERERARRRREREALNRLNRIGLDVTHAVITASTRDELEQAVCDRFVDSDAYRFAWIGEVDRGRDEVVPHVAAGVEEGYLDEVTIPIGDGASARGPTAKAVSTHGVQVMRNVSTDPEYEPWRAEAKERGYRSSAAVPIAYEDIVYGVLNVYASSPNAFSEAEAEVLSRLGDVIGHAITAIERKEALVSDTAVQLEFGVDDVAAELVALTEPDGRVIELDDLVRNDEALIAYGHVDGVPRAALAETVEATTFVDELRVLSSGETGYDIELVTEEYASLVGAVGDHGGRIESATLEAGRFEFVVEFPVGRDRRQLVALVEEHCPNATHLAQRTVERSRDDRPDFRSVFRNDLTEKQRTALETAYHAGIFEWPRQSTGQEVAERLDVSPPTFNQHFRAAQKQFFDAVFD